MQFDQMVLARLEELGENVNSFEARQGWSQGYLRKYVRQDAKRSVPDIYAAKRICDALGLECYWGAPRTGGPIATVDPLADPSYVLVKNTTAEAAAGDGRVILQEHQVEPLAFRRDWLARVGVAPDKAILLRARGDSMQPLIWDGDMLLIDTSKTSPRIRPRGRSFPGGPQDEIFVLRMDDDVRVKAIKRPAEDQVMIYSENRDRFDPEILTGAQLNDLVIIGKVVWYGHVTS